jgi:hypothetical protein
MNEIKGILWWLSSKLMIVIALLMFIMGVSYVQGILLISFVGIELLIGFLYYYGFIDKLKRKVKNEM